MLKMNNKDTLLDYFSTHSNRYDEYFSPIQKNYKISNIRCNVFAWFSVYVHYQL